MWRICAKCKMYLLAETVWYCITGPLPTAGLAGAIQCYCDESWGLPSPECFNNRYTCNSTRGCYLRRWYSHSVIKRSWDCIKDKHGVHTQINYTVAYCGAFNTPDNVYKCCNSSDMCNQDLSIVLEMEVQMTPSLPVVTPSSSVLDTTGGGEHPHTQRERLTH